MIGALKTNYCQFGYFAIAAGTVTGHYDNLRCHQLRRSCQIDDFLFSVCIHVCFQISNHAVGMKSDQVIVFLLDFHPVHLPIPFHTFFLLVLSSSLIYLILVACLSIATMHHSEQKCTHFCSKWCIVGYGIRALWNLRDWFLGKIRKLVALLSVCRFIQNLNH